MLFVRHSISYILCTGLLFAAEPLRVRVVDPLGAVIPGALVNVRGQPALRTDAAGLVETHAEAPVEIRVTAPGFARETRRLAQWEDGIVTIELRPAPVYSTVEVVVRETPGVGPAVSTAVEIDQIGARTVFDAVERLVPGAFVTRRGVMGYGIASGGTGVVTIRGIGETPNSGVLVVVDGRPDYMGLMGHPLPDFYSLSDAGTVSVTQGPASVLYGTNAMGGVIEVEPSQPRRGTSTQLSSSLGSFWTGQYRLRHGTAFGRSFYSVTAGVAHTNGDRPSSNFRGQDGTLSFGYDLSNVWKTSLQGRYGHFHVEDPGPVTQPLHGSYARVGRGGFSWNLDNSTNRTWGHMRLFSSFGNHLISDGWRSTDRTTGVRVHQHYLLAPTLTLDGGTDVVDYGGKGRNIIQGTDFGKHGVTSAAGFARLQWAPSGRLRFNAGLRQEHNSAFGSITVPEFGASIGFADGYSFSVAAGRGFRNPTIRELYLFPAPNPDLLPERLWNYQATLQAQPVTQLAASVTAYYADLSNLIVTTGRFPNLRLLNAGQALNRGWEANLRWRPVRRLAVDTGYAHLRSTNLAPYVPRHKWNYSVEVDAGWGFLHFGGVSVGRRWADAGRSRELDGYTAPTFKCTVPVGERHTFFFMVDNLFDEAYEVVTGYPMPRMNAVGGFTLNF